MNRQRRWDLRYMELARVVGTWSKDPSTQVGAVLVRPNNSVAATGFNGFAPGADDAPELYADRMYKYWNVIHAEINALNFYGQPTVGHTLYTSFPCCPECVEAAGVRGVSRIVMSPLPLGRGTAWTEEWQERLARARAQAQRYGIEMEVFRV